MAKNSLKQVKILDINISSTNYVEVLNYIQKKIEDQEKIIITTPNPEQLLLASNDQQFKDILNSSDISIPDGIGLIAAFKYNSLPRPKNILKRLIVLLKQGVQIGLSVVFDQKWLQNELKLIKGRRLFEELIISADKNKYSCVLIGDDRQSAQKAAAKLRESYSSLQIHAFSGPYLDKNANPRGKENRILEEKVIDKINRIKPQLLFIGFGAPKQEKWLYRLQNNLNFSVAMVVGGTFDYISGTRKSVPKWIEDFNFEWIYRLFTGSQKPGRVFTAFPQFAFRVFLNKLVNK